MCTFMLSHHSVTLKKKTKVKSVNRKRFAAYCFPLKLNCTLQTTTSNNKGDIGILFDLEGVVQGQI